MTYSPFARARGAVGPFVVAALSAALLAGCGGGTDSAGSGGGATTYRVGGSLSGLSGSGLVLQDNAGDDLAPSASGSFAFATALASGSAYLVSVKTQPTAPAQSCSVTAGSGVVASSDITSVAVTCVNVAAYTVGGTVAGLTGSGLVLQDNAGDDTPVSASGAFTFPTRLASGAAYAVSVKTQPASPAEVCTVASGSGTIGIASVGNVAVTCVPTDTDLRPLQLVLAPPANAATGVLFPYTVTESQGIALTSLTWSFDGVVGGHALGGLSNGALQVWNTPGSHTIQVVATASNGRSATKSATIAAVSAPLAAGELHSCALTADALVKCWGYGSNGELGNGVLSVQYAPVNVNGLSGVLGLAAGEGHSCAIRADKTVACWGDNTSGELGNAATAYTHSAVPVVVDGLSNVVGLAAGRYHTCALRGDGSVACFGTNSEGELGAGTSAVKSVAPVNVTGLSNVVAIAAGRGYFTCALKADGTVACWGDNSAGQLGSGSTASTVTTPQAVLAAGGGALTRVVALRAGKEHACAIVDDGQWSTVCWGNNNYHQVSAQGSGNYVATKVPGLSANLMLTTTDYATCDFNLPSAFSCWGSDSYAESDGLGVAGSNVTSPTAFAALQGASTPDYASGGNEFLCVLLDDGSARCVGRGGNGQLGNGAGADAFSLQTVGVAAGTFWTWLGNVPR